MTSARDRAHTHHRTLSLFTTLALGATLLAVLPTAATAAPVLAADTQQSGAGYGFGRNDFGQTNPGSTANQLGAKQLPAGQGGLLTDAISFAAGNGFVVWADHDGKVWSLGDNGSGQRGNGSSGGVSQVPVMASGFGGSGQPRAVKVAAFGLAVDVLDSNGAVWQWGQVVNNNSSLAIQSMPSQLPFPSGAARIIDVVAGSNFSLALDATHKAYAWGKNDRGQLGTNSTSTSPYPTAVQTGAGKLPATLPSGAQASIEAGRDFATYTVSSAAGVDVYTWGRGDLSQLGNNKTSDVKSPAKIAAFPAPTGGQGLKVLSLSSGTSHTLLLTNDGVVRTWGTTGVGRYTVPTTVPDPSGLLTGSHHPYTVAAGDNASFVASTDGTVAAWGTDTTGQLGRTTTGTVTSPTLINIPGTTPPTLTGPPVQLTSRGGATYALVDAQITRSPDQRGYSFGAFPTNPVASQTAPSHTFTLPNVATKALTISPALYLDGTNPGDFVLSANGCSGTLALNAACSVTVTFRPQAAGSRQAALVLRTTNTLGGVQLSSMIPLAGVGYSSVQGLQNYVLSLTSGSPTTVGGRGNVIPLTALDYSLLQESVPSTGSAALGRTPLPALGRIALGRTPLPALGRIALGRTPLPALGRIGLPALGRIAVGHVGLPALGRIGLPALGRIALGRTPLLAEGGWVTFLADYSALKDRPISSLTWLDLAQQGPEGSAAAPLDRIALGDIDLSNSAFAQASVVAALWGGTRLSQYPTDVCTDLSNIPDAGSCTDGDGMSRTLFELSFLDEIPVDVMLLNGRTIGEVTTDAQSTTSDPLADAVWPDFLLNKVRIASTHFNLPLGSIPPGNLQQVVNCSTATPQPVGTIDCTDVAGRFLGDADVAAAMKADATIRQLGSALNPLKIAWVLEPMMDASAFPWETVPRSQIPLQAYPNRLTLQADADLNCLQASGTTFGFDLPTGFTYVPGTAKVVKTNGTGTVALADPTSDPDRGLVVSVPDSSFSTTGAIACPDDSGHVTVRISVLPSETVGSAYKASGDARTGTFTASGTQQGTGVTVTGINNPPDTSPDGPLGAADTLILGHLEPGSAPLYVPFEAAQGKLIEATLSGIATDLDFVLSYPIGAPEDPVLSANPPMQVPFGEASFIEASSQSTPQRASGGALQDIPLLTDRPVAAIAATRSFDDEQLSAVARAGTNGSTRHVLSVSGFNGAGGDFTVRIRITDPTSLGVCTVTPPTVGAPAASRFFNKAGTPAVTGFAPSDTTVVLVNRQRLEAMYPGRSEAVLNAAYDYVRSAAAPGQVLQLDHDAGVRAAFQLWDQAPCDPTTSNGVGIAINTLRASAVPSSVKYVVLLGGHDLIPHLFRVDNTRDGNEREAATDLALTGSNPLAAALAAGYYPTDDPFGTTTPISVLTQVLYIPQNLVGRVGEGPDAMIDQFERFVAAGGVADPRTTSTESRTALVTDYGFLTSGGDGVETSFVDVADTVQRLKSPLRTDHQWTLAELKAAWLEKSTIPSIAALNMHYDQYRALPAEGDTTGDQSNLYTAAQVSAAPTLAKRVVLTIGCHSALDVPNRWSDAQTAERARDFAEAYLANGLAVMIGNLGFGYADSNVLAYSAKAQTYLAEGMAANYDMGTSLVESKRAYVREMISLSPYDLKSVQQMVLWGLPQYRLTSAAASLPPGAVAGAAAVAGDGAVEDPVTGLPSRTLTVDSTLQEASADGASYWRAAGPGQSDFATAAVSGYPVLPLRQVDIPDQDGMTVRSAVPVALTSNASVHRTVLFGRAGTDDRLLTQPQNAGSFPSTLGHTWTVPGSSGTQSSLVVTPAQVHLDASTPTKGDASVVTIPRIVYRVLYGAPGPVRPGTIRYVDGVTVPAAGSTPAVTSYKASVVAPQGATIAQVYVLAMPAAGYGDAVRTDLELRNGLWVGGRVGTLGRFFVVAITSEGFASLSTRNGEDWSPHTLTNGGDFSAAHFSAPAGPSGWYTSAPSVTVDPGYTLYCDGHAVPSPYTYTDGEHACSLQRPDGSFVMTPGGSTAYLTVLVDTVVPTVTATVADTGPAISEDGNLTHPLLRKSYPVTYTVSCGPSSCTTTDNLQAGGLDTSAVGLRSLTISASSVAGLTGTFVKPYRVVYDPRSSGFLSPVVNAPGLNLTVRSLVYAFGYKLVDGNNAAVTSGAGSGNTAAFTSIACPSTNNTAQLPRITGATAQPVHTGNGVWLWDLAMPNPGLDVAVCRHLRITTNDGWTHFDADLQIAP